MFGPIRAVIFDHDGTLVDTMASIVEGLGSAIASQSGTHPTEAELLASFGAAPKTILEKWLHPLQVDAALKHWLDFESKLGPGQMKAFDGIPELLQILQDKKYPIGVFTGRDRASTLAITRAQGWLGKYFTEDQMACGDDGLPTKPRPESLIALMKRMNLDPATTLMVGDHVYDAMAGRSAGCKTAAALWDNKEKAPTEKARFKLLWEKWNGVDVDLRLTSPLSLSQWLSSSE